MLDFFKLGIYTEHKSLRAIHSFESKRVLRVQTGRSPFYTPRDYCSVMAPLVLRAKILLQLQFSDVKFDLFDKSTGFSYFAYIPKLEQYIDYFESPWHRGPGGDPKSFNDTNSLDIAFVKKYTRRPEAQITWMYRAKAFTWGGSDYRKLQFAKEQSLPYYIYWSLGDIEMLVDSDVIQYSKFLQMQYLQNIKLQTVVESKLVKFLESYNTKYRGALPYVSKGGFEHFEAPNWFIDSIVR